MSKLINYRELSRIITGTATDISENRIAKKHQEKVNELLGLIEFWKNDKKPLNISRPDVWEILSDLASHTISINEAYDLITKKS